MTDQAESMNTGMSAEGAPRRFFAGTASRMAEVYRRYEKFAAVPIFAVGFLWDSLTLTRIDNPVDNILLVGYLALLGLMIVFTLRAQGGRMPPRWTRRLAPHFPWAIQFCFGALFSSYVVYYFKSASFTRTQFFFLALVFLLVANEFLQDRLENAALLAAFYSFCFLSFLAFFLPVLLAAVNEWIFLLAGLISLGASLGVFFLGFRHHPGGWERPMRRTALWMGSVVGTVTVLYFANLIPPVPLALKDAGIYHRVSRTPEGYLVHYVAPPRWRFWVDGESPFYLSPGDSVYCYTAVFAPGRLRVPVRHVWSRRTADGWVETDPIAFGIRGGRDGGYRGYTAKRNVTPGKWRVELETLRGQTLGLVTFDVVAAPDPPPPLTARLLR